MRQSLIVLVSSSMIVLSACKDQQSKQLFDSSKLNQVTFQISTGKAGAPTEEIKLNRLADKCKITARRFDEQNPTLAAADKTISCEILDSFWKFSLANNLLTLRPEESTNPVFDYGSQYIDFEWIDVRDGSQSNKLIAWSNEIGNDNLIAIIEKFKTIYNDLLSDQIELNYIKL